MSGSQNPPLKLLFLFLHSFHPLQMFYINVLFSPKVCVLLCEQTATNITGYLKTRCQHHWLVRHRICCSETLRPSLSNTYSMEAQCLALCMKHSAETGRSHCILQGSIWICTVEIILHLSTCFLTRKIEEKAAISTRTMGLP